MLNESTIPIVLLLISNL